MFRATIIAGALVAVAAWAGDAPRESDTEPSPEGEPVAIGNEHESPLALVRSVAAHLLTGPRLESAADWQAMADRGVTLVVSVDALPTPVAAEAAGITRRHVPIGYGGPTESQRAELAGVLKEWQTTGGTLLVHCHHGKHRGPAAAAMLGVWTGQLSSEQARALLADIGTSPALAGLYSCVEEPQPAEPIAAPEEAETSVMARAMAELDVAVDRDDSVLLAEAIREVERVAGDDWDRPLWDAMTRTLQSTDAAIPSSDPAVMQRCTACHVRHRD